MKRKRPVSIFFFSLIAILTCNAALTENQVRKELAEEEGRRLAAGGVSHHATSASSFVTLALDLEETQCVLFVDSCYPR